jgi:protein transport protein SEC13
MEDVFTIDSRHDGTLFHAQYDYYGKRLATCSYDGTIQIFEVSKGDLLKGDNVIKLSSFKAHHGPIWQIAWAHPKFGNMLASCSFDKKVIIWKEVKVNEWQEVTSYEHSGSANAISWAPSDCGLRLLSCSSDGTICILYEKDDNEWDKLIVCQTHKTGVNCISFAPVMYGNNYFAEDYNEKLAPLPRFATAGSDKSVKIWEYNEEAANKIVEVACLDGPDGHSDWVRDVAFCPRPDPTETILVSASEDGTIIFWKNSKIHPNEWKKIDMKKFDGPVWRISWSVAGDLLAVSSSGSNQEHLVDVYKENEHHNWERITRIDEEGGPAE